jgi:REP element-mobilizing transposase RayT
LDLFAAHVRTNHVHAILEAGDKPEKVMNTLKSYASRRLNESGVDEQGRKRWTRHGSTKWLWNRESINAAIRYVIDGQGDPVEVFEAVPLPDGRGSV